ncbi:hypothetical protein Stube_28200 [Streptomyces tubercidicus]|uniref:Uncharacterized protein n=1 Tax=Streptomyces tubercidicus TaxID=47759 RepID=A0A640UR51_9ACTN|nr:hypothetical protein Stube_28200 [Streptomyces tubercidicus]
MVDGDATGADPQLGGLEGEGGGERHGIGAAGARDEHERGLVPVLRAVVGEHVVEYAADRQAYRGDRWMGTHVRFQSFSWGASGRGRHFVTQSA